MIVAIHAGEEAKRRLQKRGFPPEIELRWMDSPGPLDVPAEVQALIDMECDPATANAYPSGITLLCNAPAHTLVELGRNDIIRFNGWPGFMEGAALEVAFDDRMEAGADDLFAVLGWKYIRVPDLPGLVAARIESMIINEACFALAEGISTEQEIDLAMRLGTNYPMGPLEWCRSIGAKQVVELLDKLAAANEIYTPAPLLREWAGQ